MYCIDPEYVQPLALPILFPSTHLAKAVFSILNKLSATSALSKKII